MKSRSLCKFSRQGPKAPGNRGGGQFTEASLSDETGACSAYPLKKKFQDAHVAIDNFKHYVSSIEDPDVRKDFEDELLSKVVALQEPQVARYKEIYEKYVKKGEISEAQAKAQVQALINEAQGLLSELKSWGDKTGIPDLSKAAVDETLRTKGDAIWRQRWNETRSAVLGIVAGFDYKGAPIQVRGSLTTGWRGPHKGQVHFNVDEFDVDMYVVHPEDFQLARRRVTPKGGKIFPDVRVPDLLQVSNNVSAALGAKFPHVEGIREPNIVLREKPP